MIKILHPLTWVMTDFIPLFPSEIWAMIDADIVMSGYLTIMDPHPPSSRLISLS